MQTEPHNWEAIESTAKELGVSDEAFRKWKIRGHVPGKWHLAILATARGRVQPHDLANGKHPPAHS